MISISNFPKHGVADYRDIFRTLSNILDGMFYKNSQQFLAIDYFQETLYVTYLIRFWICLWITQVVFPWFLKGYTETFDICQTGYSIHSKLRNFRLFWSQKWKQNIQTNERLIRLKKNNQLFNLMFLAFLSFSSF